MSSPTVRLLNLPTMMAYGFGQIGEALKTVGFSTFLLLFYQQVIGLSGTLTSVAIAISLIVDAVLDPFAGAVSDRLHSRWGRRHPFILWSALPLAISFYFLFNPPDGASESLLFVWLLVFTLIARAALTFFHVPHLALGAEMARDYAQRSTLFSFHVLFGAVGGALATMAAYWVFFPTSADFNPGTLNPAGYQSFSLAFAVGIVVAIGVCCLGTWREIPHLPSSGRDVPRFSWQQLAREVLAAFRNRSFRSIFLGLILSSLMLAIDSVFAPYMGLHFWGLSTESLGWFPMASLLGLLVGSVLVPVVTAWLDKKMTLIATAIIAILTGNVLTVQRLFDVPWLPANGSDAIFWMLFLVVFIGGVTAPLIFANLNSMFADIVDEHELETGFRREGIVFAARSFATKLVSGLGLIIGGVVLDWIQFPKGARAGTVSEEIVWNMGLVGPCAAVFVLIAVFLYSGYKLDRRRHAEILAQLATQRSRQVVSSNVTLD